MKDAAVCAQPVIVSPVAFAAQPTASAQEDLMELARNYICKECSTPVPSAHKFCGACGGNVPEDIQTLRTEFFGAMQQPGKARLILIRGDQGVDGLSYLLQGSEHYAGRQDAQILFPEDTWLNARHANFIYRGDRLVVRDEGSVNGVYVRVREPVRIKAGGMFLCGEQVFRVEALPKDTAGAEPDGTLFYSSPKRPAVFRVVQILCGGAEGITFASRTGTLEVGREGCEINFPEDVFLSAKHCRIQSNNDGTFTLTDAGSRNGTFARIDGEHVLVHGDYLFVGKQLLRVEMTA